VHLFQRLLDLVTDLRRSHWRSHLLHLVFLVVTVFAGGVFAEYLQDNDYALNWRYPIYQALLHATPWKARANRTAVVLIGDHEYWQVLRGQYPVPGDYLATLLSAIDRADPQLIAIDFNLRSPPRNAAADSRLLDAIADISRRRPVVLPVTLQTPARGDTYQRVPQSYAGRSFPPNVRIGHIHIFTDIRPIPVAQRLEDGQPQASFAEAIINLVAPEIISEFNDPDEPPFSTFLPKSEFLVIPASELASPPPTLLEKLRCRIVIVSGDWEGDPLIHSRVDDHDSPVGLIPGALVQANYIEALLGSRTYREFNRNLGRSIEGLLAIALIVLFETRRFTPASFLGLCLLVIVVGYILLENLGRYYEFYFPIVVLALHALFELIRGGWQHLRSQRMAPRRS
jgi:CHASE2 domain-containing sensor protein